jgi:glycosyltransferase involved in cell wall biosynthesis
MAALANIRALRPALDRLRWQPLTAFPGRPYRELDRAQSIRLARLLLAAEDEVIDLINETTNCETQVLHTVPELWQAHAGRHHMLVGYTVWETDTLPHHWQPLLEKVDRIMVPCEFNRALFHEASGKPVFVVPHACRNSLIPPETSEIDRFRHQHGIDSDRFVFYTINTWNARKALWDVITAYLMAFNQHDPVVLVVKTDAKGPTNPSDRGSSPTRAQVETICSNFPDAARIVIIDDTLFDRDIELLHLAGDVYVSLARSEGWGLGMFDAAWFGNPVISTGWGGQLDYLRPQWSTLLDYTLEPVVNCQGYPSYAPYQRWAHPDMDMAIDAMRDHFEHFQGHRAAALEQAAWITDTFNEEVVRHRLLDALRH